MGGVERALRHDVFPQCAVRIIEYIEEEKETTNNSSVIEIFDFFHNLLSAFCWLNELTRTVLFCSENDLKNSKSSLNMLSGKFSACVEIFENGINTLFESENIHDIFHKALSFENAGIIFGKFTEYRASTVAARYVLRLYTGIVQEVTTTIFGKSSLADIDTHDKRLDNWFDEVRGKFVAYLPPSNEWPEWKFRVDAESLIFKIGAELANIINSLDTSHKPRHIGFTLEQEQWSKPMAKTDIMQKLGFGLRGYRKLKTYTKEHPIRQVANNRQLWEIKIDKMPENLRKKFM